VTLSKELNWQLKLVCLENEKSIII
jgi:hypothetical protein